MRKSREAGSVPGHKRRQYKHEQQQSSILQNMRAFNILSQGSATPDQQTATAGEKSQSSAARPPATTFVEFGAGRAKLSLALSTEHPGANIVLVERAGGISMKADPKIREVRDEICGLR